MGAINGCGALKTAMSVFETIVAGVRMHAPMLLIHTVAAGGGSLCQFDGARFRVGPESAGANPGRPVIVGVTTCSDGLQCHAAFSQPDFFPPVFGPTRMSRSMLVLFVGNSWRLRMKLRHRLEFVGHGRISGWVLANCR